MTGRRRSLSPTESSAGSSRRTCHSSIMLQPTTPRPHRIWTLLSRDKFGVDVEGILERASLRPFILPRAEATCADETPGIEWGLFSRVFGGGLHSSEWSQCGKIQGYENFMWAHVTAQPFMPLNPGEPGLILKLPAVCETQGTFHVLAEAQKIGVLYYRGKYRKIALPHTEFRWANLPTKVCMLIHMIHILDVFLTSFSPKNCGSNASVLGPHPPCVLSVHKLTFEILSCTSPRIRTSKHICSTSSQIKSPIERLRPLSDLERRYAKHLFSSIVMGYRECPEIGNRGHTMRGV